ncbi:MAG TPA: hypothetical protein DCW97_07200 [Acidobacteria bacterium]|nr:hypothetical protein [Acidobacteriota bacterium]
MSASKRPPATITPPWLSFDYIRQQADNFRQQYVKPPDLVPVPMEDVVELDLKFQIIPIIGLQDRIDVDGFLTNNLKAICVDYNVYTDERWSSRLRFTLAHEVGHLVLHKEQIQQCRFRTPEDWIHFREDFTEDDLNWFEAQAYEFAGRLLVPKEELEQQIRSRSDEIRTFKERFPDSPDLNEAISRVICGHFGVSDQVICRRIAKEKIRL